MKIARCRMLILLTIPALSGCREDENRRLAEFAHQSAPRQAEQNHELARLNREVASGTKLLVEVDGKAREELVALQRDLQSQQPALLSGQKLMPPSLAEIPHIHGASATATAHNGQLSITRKQGHTSVEQPLADGYLKVSVYVGGQLLKIIEIIIAPDGQTRVETKGFSGVDCRQASEFLEKALGKRTNETLTSEFYQQQSQEQKLQEGA
jgi:hypothetical protein